jgi:hypothetical protein
MATDTSFFHADRKSLTLAAIRELFLVNAVPFLQLFLIPVFSIV